LNVARHLASGGWGTFAAVFALIAPGPIQLTVISLGGLSLLVSVLLLTVNLTVLVANFRGRLSGNRPHRLAPLVASGFAALGWYLLHLVIPLPAWPMWLLCGLDVSFLATNLALGRLGAR
jgi:hypothetical protein